MENNKQQDILLYAALSPHFNILSGGVGNSITSFFGCSTSLAFINSFLKFSVIKVHFFFIFFFLRLKNAKIRAQLILPLSTSQNLS